MAKKMTLAEPEIKAEKFWVVSPEAFGCNVRCQVVTRGKEVEPGK